ncbi:MAG TPA: CdaR family protein [Verrucomicrobiota bacterium]|jgi:hypothetical protein|nr:CdaR family protein [Verrucomicrobiota bacterium]HRT07157.1 CdaR family protein [Candidatus Paceibacterota bacterium]
MIAALRRLFVHDFWLKLFSLALATLIYLTIYYARDLAPSSPVPLVLESRTFTAIPVLVVSSAGDARNYKVIPKEAEVTVQGDARALQTLIARDIRLLVDMTGIEAAHGLRKRIEISTPPGISVTRIIPEEVQIVFASEGG